MGASSRRKELRRRQFSQAEESFLLSSVPTKITGPVSMSVNGPTEHQAKSALSPTIEGPSGNISDHGDEERISDTNIAVKKPRFICFIGGNRSARVLSACS